jgi:hypothetical protein
MVSSRSFFWVTNWMAPSSKAVEKHHEKYGVKCDWITEVQTTP